MPWQSPWLMLWRIVVSMFQQTIYKAVLSGNQDVEKRCSDAPNFFLFFSPRFFDARIKAIKLSWPKTAWKKTLAALCHEDFCILAASSTSFSLNGESGGIFGYFSWSMMQLPQANPMSAKTLNCCSAKRKNVSCKRETWDTVGICQWTPAWTTNKARFFR